MGSVSSNMQAMKTDLAKITADAQKNKKFVASLIAASGDLIKVEDGQRMTEVKELNSKVSDAAKAETAASKAQEEKEANEKKEVEKQEKALDKAKDEAKEAQNKE